MPHVLSLTLRSVHKIGNMILPKSYEMNIIIFPFTSFSSTLQHYFFLKFSVVLLLSAPNSSYFRLLWAGPQKLHFFTNNFENVFVCPPKNSPHSRDDRLHFDPQSYRDPFLPLTPAYLSYVCSPLFSVPSVSFAVQFRRTLTNC